MNKNTVGYVAIVLLLASTSVFSLNLFHRERNDHDISDVNTLPYRINGWEGKDVEVTEKEYDILETRNLVLRNYTDKDGNKIELFIVYSETNRSVFHPPEVCLIGSGITISDKQDDKMDLNTREIGLNKLYLEKGDHKDVILYCYKVGDLYTSNFYLQQTIFALKQIASRRTPGATIRVSASKHIGEDAATSMLKGFLKDTITELEKL